MAAAAAGGAAALAVPVAAQASGPVTGAGVVTAAEPATLTVSAPNTVARLGSVTLTGTLSAGAGTLTVTRKDLAGTRTLPSVTSDAAGAWTVRDKPPVGGTNTYTISWAGNDTYAGTSVQARVAVSRRASKVTLGVNGSTFAYRGKAKLTAKLGTTHDSRALCLWATPRGGTKTKVKCGSGTVTATYATTRRTTFSATFAGDQWYAPATATRTVTAHARITQALDRSYRTSGAEKLYRTNVDPVLVAMVSPAHPYGCIDLHAQVYDAGKWWPLPTARCVALDGTSIGGGTLVGTHKAGMRYRLRAAFAGDALNASATGSWQYLRFTR